MPPGPPKIFRTWPTVASPQAQKRLDDDAEMIMWLMGLPRRRKAGEGEDKTPEGIWEQEPTQMSQSTMSIQQRSTHRETIDL